MEDAAAVPKEHCAVRAAKLMFVATKKQAKNIVEEQAQRLRDALRYRAVVGRNAHQLFYHQKVTEENVFDRESFMKDEAYLNLAKRERLDDFEGKG
jgi:small subunit ribosomal protein S2